MNSDVGKNPGDSARRPARPFPSGRTGQPSRSPAGGSGGGRRHGDRPFIPFVRFEDIVVRCGHVEKFGLLPDGKDRFREGRRQKAMSRDCKACREKKRLEQEQAAALRRAEKEKKKALAQQARSKGRHEGGRLPDGSHFEMHYDATKSQWTGILTVPKPGGEPAKFTGSGSGLFPLLIKLDRQYRATLEPAKQETPPSEATPPASTVAEASPPA